MSRRVCPVMDLEDGHEDQMASGGTIMSELVQVACLLPLASGAPACTVRSASVPALAGPLLPPASLVTPAVVKHANCCDRVFGLQRK